MIPLIERSMVETIYKVLHEEEWRIASATSSYAGSPDDQRDGFIHFSTAPQLTGTLEKHFSGSVYIAAFDPALFPAKALCWEPSRSGALYPHLYGTFNIKCALKTWHMSIAKGGEINLSFLDGETL